MIGRAGQNGRRSWSGWARVLLPVLLTVTGCGHDWSAAGSDDAAGSDADTDGGGEGTDDTAQRDDATAEDADVADDAVPPVCGNGLLETDEECDPPYSSGSCGTATCEGVRSCDNACRWGACDFGLPPAGDTCDESALPEIVVDPTGSGTFMGSTCGATDDGVLSVCGGAGVPDVMYRLQLSQASVVTLDTNGSSFDAVLRLLQGPGCPGSDITCDAGEPIDPLPQARLQVNLPTGGYWVVVDGVAAAAQGEYVLNATITPLLPPANDSCSAAIVLTTGATIRTMSGTTAGATPDVPSDSAACAFGRDGPDVWYRLSLTERSVVYLDLLDGQTWNSVLEVRSGVCGGSTSIACEDDACGTERSRFVGWLDAGEYVVGVAGRTLIDSGSFTLRYQSLRQSRPCMANAELLLADGSHPGWTGAGTTSYVDPSCSPSVGVPEAVFCVPLCPGRALSATTCDPGTAFDTVLALMDARCLNQLGCNDDVGFGCDLGVGASTSQLDYTAADPGLSLLIVDGSQRGGRWPDSGAFTLQLSGL